MMTFTFRSTFFRQELWIRKATILPRMILLRNGDLRNIPLVNKLFPYIYEKKITFYDICLLRWDTYESRKKFPRWLKKHRQCNILEDPVLKLFWWLEADNNVCLHSQTPPSCRTLAPALSWQHRTGTGSSSKPLAQNYGCAKGLRIRAGLETLTH